MKPVDQSTASYNRVREFIARPDRFQALLDNEKALRCSTQIAVLRQARKMIERGACRGLCRALDTAATDISLGGPPQHRHYAYSSGKYLQRWVREMLDGSEWLETWLVRQGYDVPVGVRWYEVSTSARRRARAKARAARLRWIDWMIAETKRAK